MKKTAIVILNWNGKDMMRRFLPTVVAHSTNEADVYVADNGSTDGSIDMLEKEFPEVRTICLPQNYGFAEGYNQALCQIEAEYFLLLNSDVEVTPKWLEPLHHYMDSHPEVAVCQPKLLDQKRKDYFEYAGGCGGYLDRYGYPFCRGRIFHHVEQDLGQYDDIQSVLWATGAALMIRKTDWEAVGGLDGSFFAHMEEIDLCWRLRSRGRGIVCIPQSVVYHVGGASLAQGNPRKTFLNFRNNLLMLYKNLPENELHTVMRHRALLDHVAACKFLLTLDVANARAVWRARKEFHRIRAQYDNARRENLQHATTTDLPERTNNSILWQFYAKGRRTFKQLMLR